jgi:glycosyltransferase involved in cell wall biosynthesis
MKICQVAPYFPYRQHLEGISVEKGYHIGGVERHVYNLSNELSKIGNEVTVITTKSPKHKYFSDVKNIKVIRLPIDFRVYSSPISLKIFSLAFRDYDVVHAHTPVPLIADLVAIRNLNGRTPFLLTYHNDVNKNGMFNEVVAMLYNCSFGSLLLNCSDTIITTTKDYAFQSRKLRKYLYKISVVPNAVDTTRFHPRIDGYKIRERYEISKEAKVVLFVGTLAAYKGCKYLLSAFSMILKKLSNVYLILVGKGPLESNFKETAAKLGGEKRIIFAGYVKDEELPYYYASSDLFVLPSVSEFEGFGIVQLEAMASGKPVIATNIAGVREVDSEELATIHVPPKDEKALEAALLEVLRNDKLAITMGHNGRDLVEKKYSWSRVAGNILDLYKKSGYDCS